MIKDKYAIRIKRKHGVDVHKEYIRLVNRANASADFGCDKEIHWTPINLDQKRNDLVVFLEGIGEHRLAKDIDVLIESYMRNGFLGTWGIYRGKLTTKSELTHEEIVVKYGDGFKCLDNLHDFDKK